GGDPLAAFKDGFEPAIGLRQLGDHALADFETLAGAKPLRVLDEQGNGDRVDLHRRDAPLLQVCVERVHPGGIEVPVGARPQKHALGHVLAPALHRGAGQKVANPWSFGFADPEQTYGPAPITNSDVVRLASPPSPPDLLYQRPD